MIAPSSPGVPPSNQVLRAFGAVGEPEPLAGGFNGRAWRCGGVGLKPVDLPTESLEWQADLLDRLDGREEFRVAPLLRTTTGDLVCKGWLAWRFEPGDHPVQQWDAVLDAGARFHAAVADEPRPDFLDRRNDWWARGDRVAWGEADPAAYGDVPLLDEILPRLTRIDEPAQLVHGDLTANVLVHDGLPPLVIDLSPYWRPRRFAAAVVVVDALTWEGADAGLVTGHPEVGEQHLLRALVYRLVTHHLGSERRPFLLADLARYRFAMRAIG